MITAGVCKHRTKKMVKKRRQSDPCANDSDSTSEENFRVDKNDSNPKCLHIKKAVDIQRLRKFFKKSTLGTEKCGECAKMVNGDAETEDFEFDRSLWMCLKCGSHLCGRTVNQHALKHYQVSNKKKTKI